MAELDPQKGGLIIRVVYDGSPMVGKTTTVRSLAEKLGGTVSSPEEIDGRTVYFDWLDYTGGLFEGQQIRCQIVSVPGQASLASRRRRLLEKADVVVFVADSRAEFAEQTRRYLVSLRAVLEELGEPPVGVVVQANRRDDPDAQSLDDMRHALELDGPGIALMETVATAGVGVREAFVFAVRLALDRVREQMRAGALETGSLGADSASALLDELAAVESSALSLATENGLTHTSLAEARLRTPQPAVPAAPDEPAPIQQTDEAAAPLLPHSGLPGGMIWPPVDGRVMLHEAALLQPTASREADGSWLAASREWLLHSPAAARFDGEADGHEALLAWARDHSACAAVFGQRRCIVLAADGQGHQRLWQCVARVDTLHTRIAQALDGEVAGLHGVLTEASRRLARALHDWRGDLAHLPVALDSIVAGETGPPRFAGLMPYPVAPREPASKVIDILTRDLAFARERLLAHRDALRSNTSNQVARKDSASMAGLIVDGCLRAL